MKRRLQKGLLALSLLAFISSCSTTNEVASNRGIQKRKYTKGYFIDFNHNKGGNSHEVDNIANNEGVSAEEAVLTQQTPMVRSIEQEVVYIEEVQSLPVAQAVIESSEIEVIASNSNTASSDKLEFQKVETKEIQDLVIPSKFTKNQHKSMKNTAAAFNNETDDDAILYYVLAFFIPFLAVGLVTDWDVKKVVICLVLSLFFWIPGIIYALIVVSDNV